MMLWVQDLWPESVDVTGKLKNSYIRKLLVILVKYIYRKSEKIFISSKFMRESIVNKLGHKYKKDIYYLPNWAEDSFIDSEKNKTKFSKLIPDGFKIMFAGNISYGQDFPSIIQAAKILKNSSNIKFIILGDGSEKNFLESKIKEFKLEDTIYYLGSFPLEEMGNFYCHADMMLLTLRDEPIYSYTVPCKLQGYLASKKPVAAMINGEAAQIIQKSGCGFAVNAEDYKKFAKELLLMSCKEPSVLNDISNRGFEYYNKIFKKETVIDSFFKAIKS